MPNIRSGRIVLWASLLIGALLLAGCSADRSAAEEQQLRDAQATITALSTENARLATQVAIPTPPAADAVVTPTAITAPAVITPSATLTAPISTTPPAPLEAVSAPANALADAAFPAVVAEIPLAAPDQPLLDFRIDTAKRRLYVTDASQLYVLDMANFALLATLPVGGNLALDDAGQRLFVTQPYPQAEPSTISVVDTQALTISGQIADATHLALDLEHNRIFVGHAQRAVNDPFGAPVRVLNATTLAVLVDSESYGIPLYNAQRDEVLIHNATVYTADPNTLEISRDLLPEILRQECINCNGVLVVNEALLFPAANVLALRLERRTSSGGPGIVPAPLLWDATTLEPVTDPALAVQPTCGSQPLLRSLVNGQSYQSIQFLRYVARYNLLVNDAAGGLSTWRDGLGDPLINANTAQAYANGWVFDLAGLAPMGEFPAFCLFAHDREQGLLYGAHQNSLLVLAERGGQPALRPNEDAILPGRPIKAIIPSPTFVEDNTLFVVSSDNGDRLYRSNDSGQTWLRLRQGLPAFGNESYHVTISPAFGTDRTLFLGGKIGDSGRGLGVFRSVNGGDSWQPAWQGLTHLRVDDLLVSPNYTQDQTVLAYARYDQWFTQPPSAGRSVHRSSNGGLSWTLALTTTTDAPLDVQPLLPGVTAGQTLPVRRADDGQTVERSKDYGQTWTPLDFQAVADNHLVAFFPTADNQTVYILGSHGLWRVRDAGATVESWNDPRLARLTLTNTLTTFAVTSGSVDADQRLWLGTALGDLWLLEPTQMIWNVLVQESPSLLPTATATAVVTATEAVTVPVAANGPPPGLYEPQGIFANDWARDPVRQQTLGWAKSAEAKTTGAALQTFEKGLMIWRGDEKAIYVLYGDNTWQRFPDSFKEGQRESDPALAAPDGKLQPIRGFGKVWRDGTGVRTGLGWATAKEQGFDAPVQDFEHGLLLRTGGGLLYALIEQADGRRIWLVL